jgi:anti-sigma regulatory factor (Ser/Thr protein kinase)
MAPPKNAWAAPPTSRPVACRSARLILNPKPDEVRRARLFVRATLSAWDREQDRSPFELAVSELVTNGIVHGRGSLIVRLIDLVTALRLEVSDAGGAGRPVLRSTPDAIGQPGGWGLQIVQHLADIWGTVVDCQGATVWLERHTLAAPGDRRAGEDPHTRNGAGAGAGNRQGE